MKQLESTTLDRTIVVDGSDADWEGAFLPIDDKGISFGLRHDNEFLYFALITRKPEYLRQMMAMGMTVWFDPAGDKKKDIGIRFPLGLLEAGGELPLLMGSREAPSPDLLQAEFERSLGELEVIRDGERKGFRVDVEALQRVEVAAALNGGMFIYELKMPLQANEAYDYAIGAAPNQRIGVGIETPEIDRAALRKQMIERRGGSGGGMPGGGMGGGGMPGGGMGGGGMRPGGMAGGMPSMPSPVKLWVQVALSDSTHLSAF